MLYFDFKGEKISKLGFGCMRFINDPATGEVDQALANEMFAYALANGVNYFDTSYGYLGGKSELIIAEALASYPRESYYLADKFVGHCLPGPIDNKKLVEVSLRKCRTDYFDFYLLHNVTEWSAQFYDSDEYHIISDLAELKEAGVLRHLGFSFHGGPRLLEYLLTKYEGIFEFVQIQCNYLDWSLQHADQVYEIIRKHGLKAWIMESVRGGRLAVLPEDEAAALGSYTPGKSVASHGFRFVQGLDNASVILSGMNSIEQLRDNIETFSRLDPAGPEEREALFAIAERIKRDAGCVPCITDQIKGLEGMNLPTFVDCYNSYKVSRGVTTTMRLDDFADDKKPPAFAGAQWPEGSVYGGIDYREVLGELAELYRNAPQWTENHRNPAQRISRDIGLI